MNVLDDTVYSIAAPISADVVKREYVSWICLPRYHCMQTEFNCHLREQEAGEAAADDTAAVKVSKKLPIMSWDSTIGGLIVTDQEISPGHVVQIC